MFRMRGDGRPWDAPPSESGSDSSESSSDEHLVETQPQRTAPRQHFDHRATKRTSDVLPPDDGHSYYGRRRPSNQHQEYKDILSEMQAELAVSRQQREDLQSENLMMRGDLQRLMDGQAVSDSMLGRITELESENERLLIENRKLQLAEENRSALQRRLDDVREESVEKGRQHKNDLLHLADEFKQRYEALADDRDKELMELQEKHSRAVEELRRVRLRQTKSTKQTPEYKQLYDRYMKVSAEMAKLKEDVSKVGSARSDRSSRIDTGRKRSNSATSSSRLMITPPPGVLGGKGKALKEVPELKVTVKEAVEFVLEGVRECREAVVNLSMAGHNQSTAPRYNTFNPVWDDAFGFPDIDPKRSIEVVLTHKYAEGKIEHSSSTLELPKDGGNLDVMVPLNNTQGRPSGQVHLILEVPKGAPVILPPDDPRRAAMDRPLLRRSPSPAADTARRSRTPQGTSTHVTSLLGARNGQKFWICLLVRDGCFYLDTDRPSGDYDNKLSDESVRAVYQTYNGKFQTAMRKKELNKAQSEFQEEINDMKSLYASNISNNELLRRKEEEIQRLRDELKILENDRDKYSEKLLQVTHTHDDKGGQIASLQEKLAKERAAHHKAVEQSHKDKDILDASESELKKTRRELIGFKQWREKAESMIHKLETERNSDRRDRQEYEKEHERMQMELASERSRLGKLELQVLQEGEERVRSARRGEDGVIFSAKDKENEAKRLQKLAELTVENSTLKGEIDGLNLRLRSEEDQRARLTREVESLERTLKRQTGK